MITIGADPEVFVAKGGKFVIAHGLIPGNKTHPFPVENGAVQVDGVALEFNINPAQSYHEFQNHLDTVFTTLKGMVPDYDVLEDAAVTLSKEALEGVPSEALEVGCSPDVDAYSEELNEGPPEGTDIRAAGGHIHVGGIFPEGASDVEKWNTSLRLSRLLDKYVGVYSVIWDKDDLRRKVYGKAGACRPKPYGVEYRSLSNRWLFDTKLTKFVFDATMEAVAALQRGEDVESRLYQGIINGTDRTHPFFNDNPKAKLVGG